MASIGQATVPYMIYLMTALGGAGVASLSSCEKEKPVAPIVIDKGPVLIIDVKENKEMGVKYESITSAFGSVLGDAELVTTEANLKAWIVKYNKTFSDSKFPTINTIDELKAQVASGRLELSRNYNISIALDKN